ncbi:uncharacterized protein LOC144244053 [Crocuta crocuta]
MLCTPTSSTSPPVTQKKAAERHTFSAPSPSAPRRAGTSPGSQASPPASTARWQEAVENSGTLPHSWVRTRPGVHPRRSQLPRVHGAPPFQRSPEPKRRTAGR